MLFRVFAEAGVCIDDPSFRDCGTEDRGRGWTRHTPEHGHNAWEPDLRAQPLKKVEFEYEKKMSGLHRAIGEQKWLEGTTLID